MLSLLANNMLLDNQWVSTGQLYFKNFYNLFSDFFNGTARLKNVNNCLNTNHRHLSNIDCLSFVMCPLLTPLVIGFFSFFFAAAINGTYEANKASGTCHKAVYIS